jgi:hypothetical protein
MRATGDVSLAEVDAYVRERQAGATVADIARNHRRNPETVQRWLRARGIRERLTPDELKEMAERITALYADGNTIRQIAEITGRSYGSVHSTLKGNDIEMRPRGNTRSVSKRMSVITDAVLVYTGSRTIPELTQPLPFHTRYGDPALSESNAARFCIIPAEDFAGGSKVFCTAIYAAAFNHLDESKLIDWFMELPLEHGEWLSLTYYSEAFERQYTIQREV